MSHQIFFHYMQVEKKLESTSTKEKNQETASRTRKFSDLWCCKVFRLSAHEIHRFQPEGAAIPPLIAQQICILMREIGKFNSSLLLTIENITLGEPKLPVKDSNRVRKFSFKGMLNRLIFSLFFTSFLNSLQITSNNLNYLLFCTLFQLIFQIYNQLFSPTKTLIQIFSEFGLKQPGNFKFLFQSNLLSD